MSLILNIETTSKTCSVALAKNGETIQLAESTDDGFQHNEKLFPFIAEVIQKSDYELKDLNAVAVSSGPGSYTGLRIGTSAAKGLCYGLNIPLIAVNSLQALASLNTIDTDFVIPLFDARRMEVYSAVFDPHLNQLEPVKAVVVEEDFALHYLNQGKVVFLGDGAEKCKEMITHENAIFNTAVISATGLCLLSFSKFQHKDVEDLAYFEPYYLKDFVAGKPKKLL